MTHTPKAMTEQEAALLARWPILASQRRSDWVRAAAHLDDAADARAAGVPCPWCYRPDPRRPGRWLDAAGFSHDNPASSPAAGQSSDTGEGLHVGDLPTTPRQPKDNHRP